MTLSRHLLLVLVALAAGGASLHRAAPRPLTVLGFQSESSSPGLIDANARALTEIGVDGLNLVAPGRVSALDGAQRAQAARAHADGLPAALLVGNWSAAIGDFSEPLAYGTLGSRTRVAAAARQIAAAASQGAFRGVSVDLESLAPRDAPGLIRLLLHLRRDLPPADAVSICVQAFTALSDYAANGYDLAAITATGAQVVLMTYDDHGPWENVPGPIGPLAWQRAAVGALTRLVPRSRVLLGAADYGYAWRPHANDMLTVGQARALIRRSRARARWVAEVGEWTATLRDGSTVWFSDARSIGLRLRLARSLGLPGIAVWSLGTGDRVPRAG